MGSVLGLVLHTTYWACECRHRKILQQVCRGHDAGKMPEDGSTLQMGLGSLEHQAGAERTKSNRKTLILGQENEKHHMGKKQLGANTAEGPHGLW